MENTELAAAVELAKSLIAAGSLNKDDVASFVSQTKRVLEGRPEDRIDLEILPRLAKIEEQLSKKRPALKPEKPVDESSKEPESAPKEIETKAIPTAEIKQSIRPDHLVCLECGDTFKSLKLHLERSHDTTPVEYRRKFGLPAEYPMVAPAVQTAMSKRMKEVRKKIGKKAKEK